MNSALAAVTKQAKPEGTMNQAITAVKPISLEISNIVVAETFRVVEGNKSVPDMVRLQIPTGV